MNYFFTGGGGNTSAILTWTMQCTTPSEEHYKMAQGYAQAAKIVIESLLQDNRNKRADKIVFPLLFLTEQAVELYLKSILIVIDELNGGNHDIQKTHDLKKLYDNVCTAVLDVEPTSDFREGLKALEVYLSERAALIPDDEVQQREAFFAMRFPTTIKKKGYFYVNQMENIYFSLVNYYRTFPEILDRLDGYQCRYAYMLEQKQTNE